MAKAFLAALLRIFPKSRALIETNPREFHGVMFFEVQEADLLLGEPARRVSGENLVRVGSSGGNGAAFRSGRVIAGRFRSTWRWPKYGPPFS